MLADILPTLVMAPLGALVFHVGGPLFGMFADWAIGVRR